MTAATATQPTQARAALTHEMQQALSAFNEASQRIETHYHRLEGEVARLTGELETSNQKLRRNLGEKERMQAILISTLQSLTHGVLAVGRDGVVIVANPAACRLLERPLEQLATQEIDEALCEVPGADRLIALLRKGEIGESSRAAWLRGRRGESAQHLEITAVRAEEPWNRQLAGLILIEDKTEIRRLEEQAQLRSRLSGMGEIAMNLAHEIRNPLGSIALFASALEQELNGQEELQALAGQIVHGVHSLNLLVTNTLEFARTRRLAMTRVNLVEALEDTFTYLEHPLGEKHIALHFEGDADAEAEVPGDLEQLRQVFMNLALNAVQSMEPGGELRVALEAQPQECWRVIFADTGAGIPAEDLKRIFDPFYTTRPKGSGIGLAVVHSILSAHEATIDVESEPGQGTKFYLTFPSVMQFA